MSEIHCESSDSSEVHSGEASSAGNEAVSSPTETGSSAGLEAVSSHEITHASAVETTASVEIASSKPSFEVPATLEQAQKDVEMYHNQSISQILETNGRYMTESDKIRVANGAEDLRAIAHDPSLGRTGGYLYLNGHSSIEVSAINQQQMERSTKHETNHFASANREIIVPAPDKKGYTVYQTVGIRQASWFHSTETGKDSGFSVRGQGLNEGLTTLFTNQQLTELSREKGALAQRQGIYEHATELCGQLESIVGTDTLKEAYYGGNLQGLEQRVNELVGEKGYESLRDCLDRAISRDYYERVQAMREAQTILARMYEVGGGRK